MITTKAEYKYYLQRDYARYKSKPSIWDWLYHSEKYYIWKFLKELRRTEYFRNSQTNYYRRCRYLLQNIRFMRLVHKTQLYLYPNVFGPGLYLPHLGYMLVSSEATIGENCTMRPGILIASNLGSGNKKSRNVIIGNNVEFSAGCKILCKRIGDNVSIGPNAVVVKNVPDNSIVMGNPGEIVPKL